MTETTCDQRGEGVGREITAGELRAQGYKIPDNIPDCAWVPWWALSPVVGSADASESGDVKFNVQITEPFKWVESTFSISKQQKD